MDNDREIKRLKAEVKALENRIQELEIEMQLILNGSIRVPNW